MASAWERALHLIIGSDVQASSVDRTDDPRLQCLQARLQSPLLFDDMKLAVLGGSISSGSTWSVRHANWTFHAQVAQALGMRHHNGALPGTGPAFFEHCAEGQLPPRGDDADLILLEFAVNLDDDIAAYERLLRKLLLLRGVKAGRPPPTLIAVNAHEWAVDTRNPACTCRSLPQRLSACGRALAGKGEPQSAAEQKIRRLFRHYRVPVVSMRAGLAERVRSGRGAQFADIMLDCRHPSGKGHALLAQFVLARLLLPRAAEQATSTAAGMATCQVLIRDANVTRLPRPLHREGLPTPSSRCARGAQLAPLIKSTSHGFSLSDEGRYGKMGLVATAPGAELRLCLLGRDGIQAPKAVGHTASAGARTAPSRCLDQQPAEVCAHVFRSGHCWDRYFWCRATCSMCSNASATLSLGRAPTARSASWRTSHEPQHVVLWLGFLRSWQHMGRARLHCEGQCACDAITIDAHNGAFRNSVTAVQRAVLALQARASEPDAHHIGGGDSGGMCACEVVLVVRGESSSGEHKFKVLSVLLAPPRPDARLASEWDPPGTRLHADAVLDLMHRNATELAPRWERPRPREGSRRKAKPRSTKRLSV